MPNRMLLPLPLGTPHQKLLCKRLLTGYVLSFAFVYVGCVGCVCIIWAGLGSDIGMLSETGPTAVLSTASIDAMSAPIAQTAGPSAGSQGSSYGLGLFHRDGSPGVLYHGGATPGFTCNFAFDRATVRMHAMRYRRPRLLAGRCSCFYCLLSTGCCPLPAVYSWLLSAVCWLLAAVCWLLSAVCSCCWLLAAVRYPLSAVCSCCLLPAVYSCLLPAGCWLLACWLLMALEVLMAGLLT